MGFYIRKSFRAGPIRLNLSRRGLGASIGVKGARLGISSAGRAYVAGGAAGVYFRSNLAGGAGRGRRASSSGPADVVSVQVDTGATFAAQAPSSKRDPVSDLLGLKPNHRVAATILGIPAATLLLLTAIAIVGAESPNKPTYETLALLTFLAAAIAWPVLAVRQMRRARRGKDFGRALSAALRSAQAAEDVPRLRAETNATKADVSYGARAVYLDYLRDIVADRNVESNELSRLSLVEETFALPPEFIRAARVSGFRTVYLETVCDHDLDAEEEAALSHIKERLAIPDSELAEELDTVTRLAEIRGIREGKLPVLEPETKLQRDELCHFQGEARLVKQKVLRRFQEEGQKHKVEGLSIEKEGTLLVTSKRLLLVHEGTSSISLDKILDVEVDLDRGLMSIIKDGAQKPVLFTTPDVQRAGAILAAAAGL
jgi:hypothetical protein